MTTTAISITESAFRRASELALLETNPDSFLRVSVDGGGCSGFIYKYEMTTVLEQDDVIFKSEHSKIVIDPMSLEYMQGSLLDFIEELGSSYFSIKNPQATAKCGCGNSFAV
jgi:iron-sulfur cluster insertion protein